MKISILSLFFFLILFSSCKKEECTNYAGLIHTIEHTYGTYNRLYTYSYDENRRLIRRESEVETFEYMYKPDTILINIIYQTDFGITSTCFLNEYSKTDSIATIYSSGDAYYYKYFYDGDYTSSQKYYGEDSLLHWVYHYAYSNENLAVITEIASNGDTLSEIEYEYYTDKENILNASYTGQYYGGRSNKNLVKRRVEIHDSDVREYEYSYTYDSEGRIHTQTVSNVTQPDAVDLYTYY